MLDGFLALCGFAGPSREMAMADSLWKFHQEKRHTQQGQPARYKHESSLVSMQLLISNSATPTEPSKSYHLIKMHDWHNDKRDKYDKHIQALHGHFFLSRFYRTRPGDASWSCLETSRHESW